MNLKIANSLSDLNNAFTNKCFKNIVKKGYTVNKTSNYL